MAASREHASTAERMFWVHGEKVPESQIPEIFNLGNIFHEYRQTVKQFGKQEADRRFSVLLRKQLRSLIQEMVDQPLTPNFLYQLIAHEDHTIEVRDDDYPQNPNIVTRANPRAWYHLSEHTEVKTLYQASPFAKAFIDRFLLEHEQIKSLVNEHLVNDPLLSLPFIQQLSETTQPLRVQLADGKIIEGFVSNWYAMAMPATTVHRGGSSYFNLYRIIGVPREGGTFQYFVQKQGLLHKLNLKTQVKELLNLDQPDIEKVSPKTEREIMMRIIQLSPSRNKQDPEEVLTYIGKRKIRNLDKKIAKAKVRQEKQTEAIEQSITAILKIFDHELTQPEDEDQLIRLKAFFEGIGNPLYFAANVPESELVEKYHATLALGLGRDVFIASLASSIPTILQRVAGWPACGLLSAGGLALKGGANGFGGLNADLCTTCPACGATGILGSNCRCGFSRGKSLSSFLKHQSGSAHQGHTHSAKSSTAQNLLFSGLSLLPGKNSVSLGYLFSPKNATVGLEGLF